MTKQIVLKLLREHTEEFLSGEAISRQAGVSRAAVWKAVEQLRQEGYGIESVPNRGYRLTRVTARLRPEELAEQFRDCRIGRELLCFDIIDSTNNELKRRAVSGTVAQIKRAYYLDVPGKYNELNNRFPKIHVKEFGDFFHESNNLID